MILEQIFARKDDRLCVDREALLMETSAEFVERAAAAGAILERIDEIKFGDADRRRRFVYFRSAAGTWFSFAEEKKTGLLILSQERRNGWEAIVGWQPV